MRFVLANYDHSDECTIDTIKYGDLVVWESDDHYSIGVHKRDAQVFDIMFSNNYSELREYNNKWQKGHYCQGSPKGGWQVYEYEYAVPADLDDQLLTFTINEHNSKCEIQDIIWLDHQGTLDNCDACKDHH